MLDENEPMTGREAIGILVAVVIVVLIVALLRCAAFG